MFSPFFFLFFCWRGGLSLFFPSPLPHVFRRRPPRPRRARPSPPTVAWLSFRKQPAFRSLSATSAGVGFLKEAPHRSVPEGPRRGTPGRGEGGWGGLVGLRGLPPRIVPLIFPPTPSTHTPSFHTFQPFSAEPRPPPLSLTLIPPFSQSGSPSLPDSVKSTNRGEGGSRVLCVQQGASPSRPGSSGPSARAPLVPLLKKNLCLGVSFHP